MRSIKVFLIGLSVILKKNLDIAGYFAVYLMIAISLFEIFSKTSKAWIANAATAAMVAIPLAAVLGVLVNVCYLVI